jgi:hypothetical protein
VRKTTKRAAAAVRDKAQQGLEMAREGLEAAKGAAEHTFSAAKTSAAHLLDELRARVNPE